MRYRTMDEYDDYVLGRKRSEAFLHDRDAVAQAIYTRLHLLLGEWWEDLDDGLPLFEQILAQRNIEDVELIISERVVGTQGVLRVRNVSAKYDPNTRGYRYAGTADTIYGDLDLAYISDGKSFTAIPYGR